MTLFCHSWPLKPWRSASASQLRAEKDDIVASLLGAMPIIENCRVRIPYTATSFCAKDLMSVCPVAPTRPASMRCLMAPPLGPVHCRLYRPKRCGLSIRKLMIEIITQPYPFAKSIRVIHRSIDGHGLLKPMDRVSWVHGLGSRSRRPGILQKDP
jgi:hypothetical protein